MFSGCVLHICCYQDEILSKDAKQSINHFIDQSVNQTVSQLVNQIVSQLVSQTVSQQVSQLMPLINQPIHLQLTSNGPAPIVKGFLT